jgi:hypothetical protein
VREGAKPFDCHQIVTKSGAKQAKTSKLHKLKSSLSYGWQRDLVTAHPLLRLSILPGNKQLRNSPRSGSCILVPHSLASIQPPRLHRRFQSLHGSDRISIHALDVDLPCGLHATMSQDSGSSCRPRRAGAGSSRDGGGTV